VGHPQWPLILFRLIDLLAEEAVIGEPVSARLFPVPREDTGKFADFGLEMTEAPGLSRGNSIVCEQNSLAARAGKICGRTGNPEAYNSERVRVSVNANFFLLDRALYVGCPASATF
jgi:hypothetical protein